MEQFKQLKWSWHKYEEEKEVLPRKFSFETIADNDALNRHLNEIHLSVVKPKPKYSIFKSTEEILGNSITSKAGESCFELKDPRKINQRRLNCSSDLIKCYSYKSEIDRASQMYILNFLEHKLAHNPKLLKENHFRRQKPVTKIHNQLEDKWKAEAVYFNKCAEIYYYRHIGELGSLVAVDLSNQFISHWNLIRNVLKNNNYQTITMITRALSNETQTNLNHIRDINASIHQDAYMIQPNTYFAELEKYSAENFSHLLRHDDIASSHLFEEEEFDVMISMDVLKKIFTPGNKCIIPFENEKVTKFPYNTLPLHIVPCCEALEKILETLLISNIEWYNVCMHQNSFSNGTSVEESLNSFRPITINSYMEKLYSEFKAKFGHNEEVSLWELGDNRQKFTLCINKKVYFLRENVKTIISVKIEYQTNFGAEQMTKEELLNEWIQLKLMHNRVLLRYRIDARSMKILSVQELRFEEIEKEINDLYNCNPNEYLETLFSVIRCIRNLPRGEYLIEANNDGDFSKFMIFKEMEIGSAHPELAQEMSVSLECTRSWTPIDSKTPTFIHLNEIMSPCCFSYKTSDKGSYVLKTKKKVSQQHPKLKKMVAHSSSKRKELKKKAKNGKAKLISEQLRKSLRLESRCSTKK